MAISLVGTATGTTTATPPAHEAGDVFLLWAFRDGSQILAPTQPSGWTSISSAGANSCIDRLSYKRCTSSAETVGTWTSASSVILIVLRGVADGVFGANSVNGGSGTTITYPALTMTVTDGTSWVFSFSGHRSANVAITNLPSEMTLTATVSDTTDECAAFRLEGATSFTSKAVSVGGTSSGWRSASVEILAAVEAPPPTEYTQASDIGSSGSVSARMGAGLVRAAASSGAVAKALSAGKRSAIAGAASFSRSFALAKSVGLVSAGAVSSRKSIARTFALAAGSSVAAVASRAYLVAASIASTGAVVASKTAGKVRAIAGAGLVALRKSAFRSLGISSAGSMAVEATRAFLLSLSFASAGAVSAARSVGKRMAAASSGTVSARRAIGKASAITSAASVAARKVIGKAFAMASAGEAAIRKVAGKMASVLPTSSVATQKAVDAQRPVSAASVVSSVKSLSLAVSVASAGIVSAPKTIATVVGFVSVALVASVAQFIENAIIEPATKRMAATIKRVRQAAAEVRPRLAVSKAVRRAVQTVRSARSSKARKKK